MQVVRCKLGGGGGIVAIFRKELIINENKK